MGKAVEERSGNVRNAMIRHMYSSSQKDGRSKHAMQSRISTIYIVSRVHALKLLKF